MEINVTEREMAILKIINATMEIYGDGFSDVMVEDLVGETEWPVPFVKGLLGSLKKKDLIDYMDVNGEYNVYYLSVKGQNFLGVQYFD